MTPVRPLRRVLIANRGEIAVRIARAARASGIVPLGIYSEADVRAMHVDAMDDAVCVGPAAATESYLAIERVIAAARELGADALHPGYGFLSERASFARAVAQAGIVFVGPTPDAIAAMGDKIEAKRRARERGVPVVPGYDGEDQSLPTLRAQAARIGVPLLIKASAGGGGRGMRVVDDLARFDEAFESAQREALAAFGDATVLLEKYLARPRHIEFQIVADTHGKTLHLGERECSIQRRHQKILEEAPSLALDADLRERMGAAAIRAAQSVDYTNAGTVEFLLDGDRSFYFLEMNARLQVEHPVTELVHGIDLVRLQFEIASGAALALEQCDIAPVGWAIEARINAEDPANGYVPATGTISTFEHPADPQLRVDTGVRAGSHVSMYYDSMLAKFIAYGSNRAQASDVLASVLARTRIDGVATNVPLLLRILGDDDFRAGRTTTAFLTDHEDFLRPDSASEPDAAFLIAIGTLLASSRAWRVGGIGIPFRLSGARRSLALIASRTPDGGGWHIRGDLTIDVRFEVVGDRVIVRGEGMRVAGRATLEAGRIDVMLDGARYAIALAPPPILGTGDAASGHERSTIVAPMPGKIVKILVTAGDAVLERDLLVILEAMKMEHRIEASRDGVVKNVAVAAGALVANGATLVEFEA